MKIFVFILTAAAMVLSCCLGVFAAERYSLDALYVNCSEYGTGEYEAEPGTIEIAGYAYLSEFFINQGDRVYILGWFANSEKTVDRVVYRIDGETEYECDGGYYDRKEIADISPDVLPWVVDFEPDDFTKAGFGRNGELMELTGIGDLPVGEYDLEIVGKYTDGTEFVLKSIPFFVDSEGPEIMMGDVDGDGEITDWDAISFERYLAGWSGLEICLEAMDIDGDEEISDWDAIILNRYLAGWNVTIGG